MPSVAAREARGSVVADVAVLSPARRRDLEAVLEAATRSQLSWLATPLTRLLRRPGKRLRPALLLASAACGGAEDAPEALTSAAAVELLHQSSLVHDDLMDGSTHRGDDLTLHASNGNATAVIGGDYLLAVGGKLISQIGGEAAGIWHEAYLEMCEGQARESANRHRLAASEEYFLAIQGKTAALLRASCRLGGVVAGMSAREIAALADFGSAFGMLFQLIDDVMDVWSTPALWGKPVQHDVGQGVYTLPVLAAARAPGSPLPGMLGPDLPEASEPTVYEIARRDGLVPTLAAVREWREAAERALWGVSPSPARDRLAELPRRYVRATLGERVAPEHRDLMPPPHVLG